MSRRPKRRPRLVTRAPHGQRIYQQRPAALDDRPSVTTVVEDLTGDLYVLALASYAGHVIDYNQIRRPFVYHGRLWVCARGSVGPRRADGTSSGQVWCREVLLLAQYRGDLRLWQATEPDTHPHGWTGRVVVCGAARYVVLDHELHIQAAVVGREPQQLALWGEEHG